MFFRLLSVRFESFFTALLWRNGSKKRARSLLFALLILYALASLVLLFVQIFSALAQAVSQSEVEWFYFSTYALMAFGIMFIGTVMSTKAQLFSAHDNELLLSMPITPGTILASRMAGLGVLNLLICLLVAVPVYCCWAGVCGFSALGAVLFWLSVPMLSVFSLTVSCIVAWLISVLTAKLPNKALFTTLFSLAFLAAYFLAIGRLNTYFEQLAVNFSQVAASFAPILPLYWLGCGMIGQNVGKYMAVLFGMLLLFAGTYLILARSFFSIVSIKSVQHKRQYREKNRKVASQSAALLKKEAQTLFSCPAYLINGALGAFMLIAFAVAIPFIKDRIFTALAQAGFSSEQLMLCIIAAICFVMTTVTVSASSVSIEGKSLPVLRAMPVSARQILLAKLSLHSRLTMGCGILASLSASLFLRLDPVFVLLIPLIFAHLTALIGLIANLRHPYFSWLSETQCVKTGVSVLIAIFLPMALVGAPVAVYLLWLHSMAGTSAFLTGVLIFYALLDRVLLKWLLTKGTEIFDTL